MEVNECRFEGVSNEYQILPPHLDLVESIFSEIMRLFKDAAANCVMPNIV